jgi:hypothetical protein
VHGPPALASTDLETTLPIWESGPSRRTLHNSDITLLTMTFTKVIILDTEIVYYNYYGILILDTGPKSIQINLKMRSIHARAPGTRRTLIRPPSSNSLTYNDKERLDVGPRIGWTVDLWPYDMSFRNAGKMSLSVQLVDVELQVRPEIVMSVLNPRLQLARVIFPFSFTNFFLRVCQTSYLSYLSLR